MGRGGGGRLELLKEEVRFGEGEVRSRVGSDGVVNDLASLLLPLGCSSRFSTPVLVLFHQSYYLQSQLPTDTMAYPWKCKCAICRRLRSHTHELKDVNRPSTERAVQILTDMQVKWLCVLADEVRGTDQTEAKDRIVIDLRERVHELTSLLWESRTEVSRTKGYAAALSNDVDFRDKLIKDIAQAETEAEAADHESETELRLRTTTTTTNDDDERSDKLVSELKGKNGAIVLLNHRVKVRDEQISLLQNQVKAKCEETRGLMKEAERQDGRITSFRAQFDVKAEERSTLQSDNGLGCDQIGTLLADLRKKDVDIKTLKVDLDTKGNQITKLESTIADLKCNSTIDNSQVDALQATITHKDSSMAALKSTMASREAASKIQNQEINDMKTILATRDTIIANANTSISTKDQQCRSKDEQIKELAESNAALETTIGYDGEMIKKLISNKSTISRAELIKLRDDLLRQASKEGKDLEHTLAARNAEIDILQEHIVTKHKEMVSLHRRPRQQARTALCVDPVARARSSVHDPRDGP